MYEDQNLQIQSLRQTATIMLVHQAVIVKNTHHIFLLAIYVLATLLQTKLNVFLKHSK